MKAFNSLILFLGLFLIFNIDVAAQETLKERSSEAAFQSFGKAIVSENAIPVQAMAEQYNLMKSGDTLNSKIMATVKEVCQAKGCWMTLNLEDGNEVMVKFKDYGFFMPKDIAGKEVIANGKAFVEEMSVDEQKHFAEDAGQTEDEIAKITKPKKTYSFEADGVLVRE